MSDTVSFVELDGQHVELLPARTVLSMFSTQDGSLIPKDPFSDLLNKGLSSELLDKFLPGMNPGSEANGSAGSKS